MSCHREADWLTGGQPQPNFVECENQLFFVSFFFPTLPLPPPLISMMPDWEKSFGEEEEKEGKKKKKHYLCNVW